ncbi:hypothetical protein EOI86_05630 [Hwanghaeella grinnelliae]|uniref:Uncharacterized protein n=1 Tax=Hwanghaeella grinnelliae TaxID=2500179 RepID=A0A437QW48_9PROT|nr:hypothetical protein [Hwanghaeella grinnelliae]RVU38751.1 hypothetical protein EOI86_05630 [Hwanghaeella grinnelliae]
MTDLGIPFYKSTGYTGMLFVKLFDPLRGQYQGTVFAESDTPVPPVVWFGLPVTLLLASVVFLLIDRDLFVWWAGSETGPGENITASVFVLAAVLAFVLARQKRLIPVAWLRGSFYSLFAVAMFVAGEEWSWGQHFFGWHTPEWLSDINKQGETNLHNVAENTLDQKPRAVATFIILIFGFFLPLFRSGLKFLDKYPFVDWLMPTRALVPTSLIVFLPRLAERIQLWFDISVTGPYVMTTRDYQELQELYISLFVFIYLLNLLLRIRRYR